MRIDVIFKTAAKFGTRFYHVAQENQNKQHPHKHVFEACFQQLYKQWVATRFPTWILMKNQEYEKKLYVEMFRAHKVYSKRNILVDKLKCKPVNLGSNV